MHDALTASENPDLSAAVAGGSNMNADWPVITGFEIRQQLGRDGQGEVYRAFDESLRAEVALKIPRRAHAAAFEQLRDEARTLAQVRHPNVVSVCSCDQRDGHQYFTMQLVEGSDAARVIRNLRNAATLPEDPLPLARLIGLDIARLAPEVEAALAGPRPYFRLVALWMAQAADGLAAAQAAGILHRDLKPSNVIIGRDGRLVVVDFGLARALVVSRESARGLTGTYPYIAPERIAGDAMNIDHRSDIWAIGATLYELLTLRRAYDRTGPQVLQDIGTRDPIPVLQVAPHVPGELAAICEKTLRRDPAARYQDWRSLSQALRGFIADARPNHSHRRNRALWIGMLTLIALALVAMPWSAADLFGDRQEAPSGQQRSPAAAAAQPDEVIDASAQTESPRKILPDQAAIAMHSAPPSLSVDATAADPCTEPSSRRVLLVCNQDRNTADERDIQSAGWLPGEDRLAAYLERHGFEVLSSMQSPAVWTETQARQRAEHADASIVILATFTATPGPAFDVSTSAEPLYPWELTLQTHAIRTCDGARRDRRAKQRDSRPAVLEPALEAEWKLAQDGRRLQVREVFKPHEAGFYTFSGNIDEKLIRSVAPDLVNDLEGLLSQP